MRPVLVLLVAVWIVAWAAAVYVAVTTPWPGSRELPAPHEVEVAHAEVVVSGVVGVGLLAVASALAAWCSRTPAAFLLGMGAFGACCFTALLWSLAS